MGSQFQVLNEKLQSLLDTLAKEEKESKVTDFSNIFVSGCLYHYVCLFM